jgi:hypothetical protein
MKRAPKIYRRKKAGKFVGNFFVDVKGVSVNLGTKDAPLATRRRVDALKGVRVFEEDVDAAAAGVVDAIAPKPHPLETAPPAPAPAPVAPPADPAPTLSIVPPLPPEPPPEEIPSGPPPEGWADAVEAAAVEGDRGPEGEPERAVAAAEFAVTMDDILKVLKMPAGELAPAAVELQLQAHEWIANLRGKTLAPIPPDHLGRGLTTAAYVPIIEALQADKIKINPLYLLLAGTGLMLVTQLKGMQDKPRAPLAAAA